MLALVDARMNDYKVSETASSTVGDDAALPTQLPVRPAADFNFDRNPLAALARPCQQSLDQLRGGRPPMEVMNHQSRRGPAPDPRLDWLHAASAAPGKSLHLALLLLKRSAGKPCPVVSLTRRMMAEGGISRDACYPGVRRLAALGLVTARRVPGRALQVVLLEPGTDQYLRSS